MSTPPINPFVTLLHGEHLGQFLIGDYRARGQFSLVFEGHNLATDDEVAVKVLTQVTDPSALFEFQREGELLGELEKSDNIVTLFSTGTESIEIQTQQGVSVPLTFHYHALDLADGVLEEIALKRHEVSLKERLQLWRSVVRGIHQMHIKQIVHRDLKSSNCLVFPSCDSKSRAKVSDLGRGADTKVPHHFRPDDYLTGRGDFRFAPPECLFAQAGTDRNACKSADIYGLGSLLFELVTGQGITSQVLGYGPSIVRQAVNQAASGRSIDLSSLRGKYEDAFLLFEQEIPPAIRQLAGSLIRLLCDPVPEMRVPKTRIGFRSLTPSDLEWLLRRADILIKTLEIARRPR